MKVPMIATAGLAAAAIAVGATAVGCSSNKSAPSSSSSTSSSSTGSSSSSTSAAAAPTDYSNLLIQATDINVPGDTFTAQQPMQNPGGHPGIAVSFVNQAGTRNLGDTILILSDAPSAAAAADSTKSNMANSIAGGGNPQPSPVGSNGTIYSGASTDGSKSITALVFNEGKAIVTMEFDGAPNDPAPPDVVNDLGQKQDAALKAGGVGG
jgi:hypothetical protein